MEMVLNNNQFSIHNPIHLSCHSRNYQLTTWTFYLELFISSCVSMTTLLAPKLISLICVINRQNTIQQVTVVLEMFNNNLIVYLAGNYLFNFLLATLNCIVSLSFILDYSCITKLNSQLQELLKINILLLKQLPF